MTICERIFELINKKNLKTADLAKKLDIQQSVLSNWKKRNTNPPMEYALVICEFLGITIEELITGQSGNSMTPEEKQLLDAYRNAAPGIQQATRKLLDLPETADQKAKGKLSHSKIG